MEITQFTYFQQAGGLECKPVTGEITYGLERLCMPGAIHDVDYAALVADPESTLRAALAHIGLEFDSSLLDESVDAGPVATLSSAQVRAPLSDARRRDWQRYATQLESLRARLGE